MTALHRIVGFGIVAGLLALFLIGVGLRLARRDEAPAWFWGLQHWIENVLVAQVVIGTVLLVAGRRVAGGDLVFLHYFYGSLFPLIAVVSGRIAALRREHHDWIGLTWGAFFGFGLTTRALMTGLGIGV